MFLEECNHLPAPELTRHNGLSRCINAMHLEDVLGDIQTDCANLHVDDPSDVVSCQRSPYGTLMPREGVVHYIRLVRPSHVCEEAALALGAEVTRLFDS
jgi:hypothetical protein